MATERQLNLLLIFLTVNALCVVVGNCCVDLDDDDDNDIYVPNCNHRNPPKTRVCPPPSSKCDTTVKGVCVIDPLCTGGIANVMTWRKLSECQRKELRQERNKKDLPNYLFFRNMNRAKCIKLSKKRLGLFGCCEKQTCRGKRGCPAGIQNYPFNCGAAEC